MDKVNAETRSRIMSAIKSKNTKPEIKLRRALWARGCRYRVQFGREKIDIAFPKKKVAVFVDGCFWHGCPLHSKLPKSNTLYWHPKLSKNKERDKEKQLRLVNEGWLVLRFWEHELSNVEEVVERVILAINDARHS